MVDRYSKAPTTVTLAAWLVMLQLTTVVTAHPAGAEPEQDRMQRLIGQLRGKGCPFSSYPSSDPASRPCNPRRAIGIIDWLFRSDLECIRDAADCLSALGPAAKAAVPALIEAVRTGPNNYDTGDGTIRVRDAIVEALGRTGDASALDVLIEALENPKPMDVSYRAIPRIEPVGEHAALTALGYLGPAAAAAVPNILPHLDHSNRRVAEAAATALGKIGDASAIPALIEALRHADITPRVAEALGHFGPPAAAALPILVGLIEQSPDRPGEVLIRQAIERIGGRAAADALEKTYSRILNDLWRIARATAIGHGIRLRGAKLSGPKEEFTTKLPGDATLAITLSREAWSARRIAEGTVTVTRPAADPLRETYRGIDQLQQVLGRLLEPPRP